MAFQCRPPGTDSDRRARTGSAPYGDGSATASYGRLQQEMEVL